QVQDIGGTGRRSGIVVTEGRELEMVVVPELPNHAVAVSQLFQLAGPTVINAVGGQVSGSGCASVFDVIQAAHRVVVRFHDAPAGVRKRSHLIGIIVRVL